MAEIQDLMRDCLKAMEEHNIEKTLSFFAEDGVFINPFGRFEGKEQISKFMVFTEKQMGRYTAEEAGNGIIVNGQKGYFEHLVKATIEGKEVETPAMCAWVFDENNKVKEIRTIYDRFSTMQQAATGISGFIVGMIGKQFEVK